MYRLELLASSIKTDADRPLKGKTVVITGASRGIGLAIAIKCAKDGANVCILAKTAEPHPKLPGTIYTAAQEVKKAGGNALPLKCDIRFEEQVKSSIEKVVETFGGIDILVNNASAVNWSSSIDQQMKKFDLMHSIIVRGTFMLSKQCLPYLLKSSNPHILNITIPLNYYPPERLAEKLAYSMMKVGASYCTLGMAEEFKKEGVAVNALWPKKTIWTSAISNVLGGEEVKKRSRSPSIMADAAYLILTRNSRNHTGQFYLDENLLTENGATDIEAYKYQQ